MSMDNLWLSSEPIAEKHPYDLMPPSRLAWQQTTITSAPPHAERIPPITSPTVFALLVTHGFTPLPMERQHLLPLQRKHIQQMLPSLSAL